MTEAPDKIDSPVGLLARTKAAGPWQTAETGYKVSLACSAAGSLIMAMYLFVIVKLWCASVTRITTDAKLERITHLLKQLGESLVEGQIHHGSMLQHVSHYT